MSAANTPLMSTHEDLRIVTWNCHRGPLAPKRARLEALLPTFAAIQECPRPDVAKESFLWHGTNPRQGIGVSVGPGYSVELAPLRDAPTYNLPVHIRGPQSFFALVNWSQKSSLYVEGIHRAIEAYRDLIEANPAVVLGDFNSNLFWDGKHPAGRNHSALVQVLADLGLVSAYHHFYKERQGEESRPTIYFQWNRHRPYHIDYCFIPESWTSRLRSVEVGTFDDWSDSSDHRPLTVDLSLPTPSSSAS